MVWWLLYHHKGPIAIATASECRCQPVSNAASSRSGTLFGGEMVSFDIDPQFCGLLFSLYARHEKSGSVLTGPPPLPDALAISSNGENMYNSDIVSFAGTVGFEICRISATWGVFVDAVKTTGILLLFGMGSFACYRLYHYIRPCVRSPPSSRRRRRRWFSHAHRIFATFLEDEQLVQETSENEEDDYQLVQSKYFGPNEDHEESSINSISQPSDGSKNYMADTSASFSPDGEYTSDDGVSLSSSTSLNGMQTPPGNGTVSLSWTPNHQHESSSTCGIRHQSFPNSPHRASQYDQLVQKFAFSQPELGSKSIKTRRLSFRRRSSNPLPVLVNEQIWPKSRKMFSVDNGKDSGEPVDSVDATFRTSFDALENRFDPDGAENDLVYDDEIIPIYNRRGSLLSLDWENSTDSSRLSDFLSDSNLKRYRCIQRDTSIDSFCSDVDFSFQEGVGEGTMEYLEKLQEEIDKLKDNCLTMDEEIDSLRRPEDPVNSSDNLEDVALRRTSIPKSLYILSTANVSISSELSDVLGENFEFDDMTEFFAPARLEQVDEETQPSLEWDNEGFAEYPEEEDFVVPEGKFYLPGQVIEMDMEEELVQKSKEVLSAVNSQSSFDSKESSVDPEDKRFTSQVSQTCVPEGLTNVKRKSWSSEESGYVDESAMENSLSTMYSSSLSPITEAGNTVSQGLAHSSSLSLSESDYATETASGVTSPTFISVGDKIPLLQYVEREWKGSTPTAEKMRKGYAEICTDLKLPYIRQIRGDNYCALRAAIFQVMRRGLPVPCGVETCLKLQQGCSNGCSWLNNWSFAGRLPGSASNTWDRIEQCLHTWDDTVKKLSESNNREYLLVSLLNDPACIDIYLMEALKLHMLVKCMDLHNANVSGQEIPLFAILMFARDTSENPKDFMNNHLNAVGNTGGLEQVEMFLLGHTLETNVLVVRPSCHGQEDFLCYYPDWNVGKWPSITLIAEDDRHYNVLTD